MLSLFVLCTIALSMAGPAAAQAIATDSLATVLTKQNPYPVEPGQVVDIEVSLQNDGYGEAQNMILEINPKSPFTLLPDQERTKAFSRIAARDHVTASYKLYVDKNAISNNYELEFKFYQTGSEVQKTDEVLVQVQGEPKLALDRIETDPADMGPGDAVAITVYIKNVGSGAASQIQAGLVSNTTLILPVLSGGLSYINSIRPGEAGIATFRMSIDNAAEYQTYPSTLAIGYQDESGTAQTASFVVGLPVRGRPVIEILSAKMESSDFKVDIENIGTANAKALKVLLIQGGSVVDSAIASELRPAKSKTIRFAGFEQGQAMVNISYLDESNQPFSEEYPVSITASASGEQGGNGGLSPLVPVLIVVVVLESYYVWRIRKKAKK